MIPCGAAYGSALHGESPEAFRGVIDCDLARRAAPRAGTLEGVPGYIGAVFFKRRDHPRLPQYTGEKISGVITTHPSRQFCTQGRRADRSNAVLDLDGRKSRQTSLHFDQGLRARAATITLLRAGCAEHDFSFIHRGD